MFNEDIIIDRNALEEECSRAPAFFDYWHTQEANLKTDLENKEADLSKEIRACEESELKKKYGIPKLTEGAISAVIKSNYEYKSLRRKFLQAEANSVGRGHDKPEERRRKGSHKPRRQRLSRCCVPGESRQRSRARNPVLPQRFRPPKGA